MSGHRPVFDALADLLEYPGPGLAQAASRCRDLLGAYPREARRIEEFAAFVRGADLASLEELYTRTFDLHPPHCLDVGYQLFGESYKRGLFLVKVQRAVGAHAIGHKGVLPDHLPVMLRLLSAVGSEEDPRGLAEEAIVPALGKIREAFKEAGVPSPLPSGEDGERSETGEGARDFPRHCTKAPSCSPSPEAVSSTHRATVEPLLRGADEGAEGGRGAGSRPGGASGRAQSVSRQVSRPRPSDRLSPQPPRPLPRRGGFKLAARSDQETAPEGRGDAGTDNPYRTILDACLAVVMGELAIDRILPVPGDPVAALPAGAPGRTMEMS